MSRSAFPIGRISGFIHIFFRRGMCLGRHLYGDGGHGEQKMTALPRNVYKEKGEKEIKEGRKRQKQRIK